MNNIEMIFGSPGTGKTTYLINLLKELLKEYAPNEIAFVSFTKKGSYEGRDRAVEELCLKQSDFEYFRTIHSIVFRDLKLSKYDIISKRHYKEFSRAMGMNFVGYYTEELVNNDDKYLFISSLMKNNKERAEAVLQEDTDINFSKLKHVESSFTTYKKTQGVKDFDDILVEFIKKGKSIPVKVAIIDEAQDLTSLQWEVCKTAFKDCDKIYIAGDDDQAIYEWSGADIKQFLNLTNKSKITILDKSWRLKKNIFDISRKLSKKIKIRIDKDFSPLSEGGNIYYYNDVSEININNEQTYYFLSRNRYFLKIYKDYLISIGMNYWLKDEYSIDKGLYKAIKRYEYLRQKDPSNLLKETALTMYLRLDINFKKVQPVWYNAFQLTIEEENYYRKLFKNKVDIDICKINVNTIHGVKGGEADNVILLLDMTKNVSTNLYESPSSLDSELRCLYVAFTRAKSNLHIVYSNSKFGYDSIVTGLN